MGDKIPYHILTVCITKPDGELLDKIKIVEEEPGRDPIAVSHDIADLVTSNYETSES